MTPLNREIRELENVKIPDAMDEMGVDSVGCPDANCDVFLHDWLKANIAAGWDGTEARGGVFVAEKE